MLSCLDRRVRFFYWTLAIWIGHGIIHF
uniref:Uncharacterized protein n=1 Tax=Anguilla anguilla TaxID=7936 RepID=A0A0E9VDP1_ANGAN